MYKLFFGVIIILCYSTLLILGERNHFQQEGNLIHTTTTLSEARYHLASTSSGELVFLVVDGMEQEQVNEWIFTM
jgi:hypothetical protein